jgi:hypothetical protein
LPRLGKTSILSLNIFSKRNDYHFGLKATERNQPHAFVTTASVFLLIINGK